MTARTLFLALYCALASAALEAGPTSPPETALADYVAEADESYAWRVHARYDAPGAEVVELRLHSQTWRDILWKHQLWLVKPDDLDAANARQALFVIGGGRWRESYDDEPASELPEDAPIYVGIANQLDTVVAVLGQVPFQPLFGLREDDLIAHTFVQYLESDDAEWPLLLPMVKSVVKAMDAIQAFTPDEWRVDIERFTVLGGSKRGWTTWLTGAVEPRAAALVPIVIDVLNFEAHMPHQVAVWGEPSEQISPYTRRGLDDVLGSEAGSALRRIVDPYSYRDRLTQPKLIVVATNDAYFPLDALNLYWEDLPDPKHVLYLPNDGHGVEDLGRLIPALHAFHRTAASGEKLPQLEWEYEERPSGLLLCVRAEPAPEAVTVWSAASEDTDFRDERFSPAPASLEDDVYVYSIDAEPSGYLAVFAEAAFDDLEGGYTLSTNVRIAAPDGTAPFPESGPSGRSGVCP